MTKKTFVSSKKYKAAFTSSRLKTCCIVSTINSYRTHYTTISLVQSPIQTYLQETASIHTNDTIPYIYKGVLSLSNQHLSDTISCIHCTFHLKKQEIQQLKKYYVQ